MTLQGGPVEPQRLLWGQGSAGGQWGSVVMGGGGQGVRAIDNGLMNY